MSASASDRGGTEPLVVAAASFPIVFLGIIEVSVARVLVDTASSVWLVEVKLSPFSRGGEEEDKGVFVTSRSQFNFSEQPLVSLEIICRRPSIFKTAKF